ncbi:MAG: DUF2231 domain-containing protein [Pseudonocardiaceae bacterium]|nr:DUF2231 domain-containing protein [Pseudonocardiaceae bacterium]
MGTVMITSGAVSAPPLPHHRRVRPPTRRNSRLCRGPGVAWGASNPTRLDGIAHDPAEGRRRQAAAPAADRYRHRCLHGRCCDAGGGCVRFQEAAMAVGSVLAIAVGLIAAVPTIITRLVDLSDIPASSPARTVGWWHLTPVATATGMFAGTVRLQLAGYSDGEIITSGLVLGVISEVLLIGGSYLGGALTFVYGTRVLNRPRATVSERSFPAARTGILTAAATEAPGDDGSYERADDRMTEQRCTDPGDHADQYVR